MVVSDSFTRFEAADDGCLQDSYFTSLFFLCFDGIAPPVRVDFGTNGHGRAAQVLLVRNSRRCLEDVPVVAETVVAIIIPTVLVVLMVRKHGNRGSCVPSPMFHDDGLIAIVLPRQFKTMS